MGIFDNLDQPVFLKEDSDVSKYILKLKELHSKAPEDVKKDIEKEIKIATIGEFGENNIAFELKNCGIPMYILRDIHLEINDLSAQIDYIVVTKKINFIIECKNLIGNIEIDDKGNFIRNYELNRKRIKEGIYSPITQNQRHMEILRQIRRTAQGNILNKLLFDRYFDENYKSIVILANPKTILNARYAKKEIKQMVIRADQLNKYIKDLNKQSKIPAYSDKEMKMFAEKLLELHTPNKTDYAKKYDEIINLLEKEKYISKEQSNTIPKEKLIEELKGFRLETSRKEKIKPYYIFNDKQMMDLIEKSPQSREELLNVFGFGEAKVNKYGEEILEILNS